MKLLEIYVLIELGVCGGELNSGLRVFCYLGCEHDLRIVLVKSCL